MSLIEKFECGDVVENRYQLDIKIHEGRWGDIYRATDRLNDRPVAIRFFPVGDDGPEDYDRFEAHARELSGLTAPTVATPTDHGMEDDVPYLVFRWAQGQNLEDRLAERGALDLDKTLLIVEKVLDGLSRAHDSRLTHGLLRPVKIIVDDLDDDPFVKIVDLQIWRFYEWASGEEAFEETNLSRRIVRYTSPEVLDDHRVKPSTDIYGLGLITIEMLTGQPAFDGNNRVARIGRQLSDEVADPGPDAEIGTALREFIDRLVAKDEQERFRTGAEALEAFEKDSETFLSEPATTGEELREDEPETPDEPAEESDESASDDEQPDEPAEESDESSPQMGVLDSGDDETTDDSDDDSDPGIDLPTPDTGNESNLGAESSEDDGPGLDLPSPSETSEASEDLAVADESEESDVDPDDELFEGDPAQMHSLSDGDSLADDDDDELFESDPDFGNFYDDSGRSPDELGADDEGSEPELELDDSPPQPDGGPASPDQDTDDKPREYDDSIAEDIPAAGSAQSVSDSNAYDQPGTTTDRSPGNNRSGSRPGSAAGGPSSATARPGPDQSGPRQQHGHPGSGAQPRPQSGAGRRSRRTPPDDSDISFPVAAGIAIAMLALIGAATAYLLMPDDDPQEETTAAAELAEQQEEEIFTVEISTDPPAQNVQIQEGASGMSPLEIEVVEADFPLEIQARKSADSVEHEVVEEPGDHEIFFDFSD